jgi:hypothetical protein
MKYLMMVKVDPHTDEGRRYETGTPPDPRLLAAMGKHAEEMARAGILLGTGGLLPSARGARVRAADGRLSVTGQRFMQIHVDVLGPAYQGELEIRQMYDGANCGDKSTS